MLTEASQKKRASLHVVQGKSALAAFDRGGLEPLDCSQAEFSAALKRENHTLKRSLADPRLCIVVADISPAGSMARFRSEFPERFINVGVAEQAMIGICAGLALRGLRPFAYTIATFTFYRPFEFVRDDLLASGFRYWAGNCPSRCAAPMNR